MRSDCPQRVGEPKTPLSEKPNMVIDRDRIAELRRVAGRGPGVWGWEENTRVHLGIR